MSDRPVHAPRDWAVGTRIGMVAGGGMVLGLAISYDLDQSAATADRECAGSKNICFGMGLPVGLAVGVGIVVVGCWLCFSMAGVRPRSVTIPAGILAVIVVTLRYLAAVPGGRLHPAWLFALLMGVAFALLTGGVTLLQADAVPRWLRLLGGPC
jgi:hypothetical protein